MGFSKGGTGEYNGSIKDSEPGVSGEGSEFCSNVGDERESEEGGCSGSEDRLIRGDEEPKEEKAQ